jgi:hypothetical protein
MDQSISGGSLIFWAVLPNMLQKGLEAPPSGGVLPRRLPDAALVPGGILPRPLFHDGATISVPPPRSRHA